MPTDTLAHGKTARLFHAMPVLVRVALGLLLLVTIHHLVDAAKSIAAIQQLWQMREQPGMQYVVPAVAFGTFVEFAPSLMLSLALLLRKNWARMGWAIYTLFVLGMRLFNHHTLTEPGAQVAPASVALVVQCVAVYLLFTASSRHWFVRAPASQP